MNMTISLENNQQSLNQIKLKVKHANNRYNKQISRNKSKSLNNMMITGQIPKVIPKKEIEVNLSVIPIPVVIDEKKQVNTKIIYTKVNLHHDNQQLNSKSNLLKTNMKSAVIRLERSRSVD